MTITIASYQRRDALLRLLRAIDGQLAASPDAREGVQVVVVLDGSTDGSREAVEEETWSVPVRVHWQPNKGLAAARNVGLAAAAGGIVWFLDDDLIPSAGLVERHRRGHDTGPPGVLVGPCRIPPDVDAPAALLRWWDAFYEDLARAETIDRFDRFTTANASAPADVLLAAGGFDERFVAYGLEDYELAVRLLDVGTPLRFDAGAVAWHPDIPTFATFVARQRSIGYNAARLAHLHPQTLDLLFPLGEVTPPRALLHMAGVRSPRALTVVSSLALGVHRVLARVHLRLARPWEHMARTAI